MRCTCSTLHAPVATCIAYSYMYTVHRSWYTTCTHVNGHSCLLLQKATNFKLWPALAGWLQALQTALGISLECDVTIPPRPRVSCVVVTITSAGDHLSSSSCRVPTSWCVALHSGEGVRSKSSTLTCEVLKGPQLTGWLGLCNENARIKCSQVQKYVRIGSCSVNTWYCMLFKPERSCLSLAT